MTALGTAYQYQRQAADDLRLAASIAAAGGHSAAASRYATEAEHHDRRAEAIRTQLHAARTIAGRPAAQHTLSSLPLP